MTNHTHLDPHNLPGHVDGFPNTMSFRDLGGLVAADGRRVRPGLLYRSAALVDLDEDQKARIDALGLRFILDLRALGEVEGKPDYVPEGASYERVGGMYDDQGEEVDFSPAGIARMAQQIEDKGELLMRGLYESMMFDNPALRTLIRAFSQRNAPLLFHCTAGKDRTGVCAAVLLTALGVPDDQIVEEFLLTNAYRAEIINSVPDDLPEDFPPKLKEDQRRRWAQINGVSAGDLEASLAAVDARYPSREAYFADQFAVGAEDLTALRAWYLA